MCESVITVDNEIQSSTDGEWLLRELRLSLELSVAQVVRMAAIVRRLEEIGVVIDIRFSALPFLRRIAFGNMVPELYVALNGCTTLLSKAAALPTPDQNRIARNEPIKIMELNGDHRMVPPLSLTDKEIRQVFSNGRLRDDAEQVGWLRGRLSKENRPKADIEPAVTLDKKRGGINVAGRFVSSSEMAHYLAELSRPRR